MDEVDETVARILAKMGTPTEVPRRREVSASIMAIRAFALAFHAARHDLFDRNASMSRRRKAAKRLLEADMRSYLSAEEEAFAVAILAVRSAGGGRSIPAPSMAIPKRPNQACR